MDKQKRQDILIKICCIIASLALWIYIRGTENPITTHSIKYVPVEIINQNALNQSELTMIPGQEFFVNLSIKGPYTSVYDVDKNQDFKIVADLSKYALKAGENRIPVEIKKSPNQVSVLNGEALIVKINLDTLIDKQIGVIPKMFGETPEGFYTDTPVISTQTVKVSGGKNFVEKIANVVADIDVTNATMNIDKTVQLKAVNSNGEEIKDVKISPAYAQIKVSINKGKMVAIEVKSYGNTSNGIVIESIEAIPQKIEVIGSADNLNNLSSIPTEAINLSRIKEDATIDVKLAPPKGISLTKGVTTVKVKITLKKLSQKTISLPIKHSNLMEDATVVLDKETVEVVISGLEGDLNKVTVDSLTALINLKDLKEGEHTVPVNISGIPNNVQKVSQSLSNVKATIEKTSEVISDNVN